MRIALSAVVLLIAGLTVALFAFAMARGKGRGRRGGGNGRSNRVGERRPQDDSAPSKTTPTGPRGRVPPPEHSPHNLTAIDASGRWRAELEALRRLGTSATTVDCGESLAASCARCPEAAGTPQCGGDCAWAEDGSRRCEPLAARGGGSAAELGGGSWRFDASRDTLWLLSPSPLVALGVASLLLGGGGTTPRCAARASSPYAAGTAALCSGGAGVRGGAVSAWATAALLPPRGRPPPCACASSSRPPWLLSPLTHPTPTAAAAASGRGRLLAAAVLRAPEELLAAELLPHPGLCAAAAPPAANGSACARRAVPPPSAPVAERASYVIDCCANPMARSLVASLGGAAAARCAAAGGGCDDATLGSMATTALLSLAFVSVHGISVATTRLLREQLGSAIVGDPKAINGAQWRTYASEVDAAADAFASVATPAEAALTVAQRRAWHVANRVDRELYALAEGVAHLRMRRRGVPARAPPLPSPAYDVKIQLDLSRIFVTVKGDGRRASVVSPPIRFRRQVDTLVFLHIAKCGGTSFNKRLTMLDFHPPCECDERALKYHNGHPVVQPKSCHCWRWDPSTSEGRRNASLHWAENVPGKVPGARSDWAFLQRQWLVSPDTTGWQGGVHTPVHVLQQYVMLAAKLAASVPLAGHLRYVTIVREPLQRFLSEFYETYDGWEHKYATWPKSERACSTLLPERLQEVAAGGIDKTTKAKYDVLFERWIECPYNMAANRQTRSLGYASDVRVNDRVKALVCAGLPDPDPEDRCEAVAARHALLQFSWFGLNEERCLSERLFEAQFGLRFHADKGARVRADEGKGAHRVAKLRYASLTAPQQARVAALNRNDLLVYEEARQVFFARLRAYGIPRDACAS